MAEVMLWRRGSRAGVVALTTAALVGGGLVVTSASSPAAAATACTPEPGFTNCLVFDATNADQEFTVPLGASAIDVSLWGAGGAGRPGVRGGGGGGYTHATYDAAPGSELQLVVGAAGGSATWARTYGGGGAAGTGPNFGGAGGGMSGIFLNGEAVVIAGGGGGSSVRSSGTTTANAGGGGGGTNGSTVANQNAQQGQPGTQTAGGSAGTGATCSVRATAPGVQFQGGDGGSMPTVIGQPNGGGGGGGGYFGGGGGSCGSAVTIGAGGGAGGSGYIGGAGISSATMVSGTSASAVNTGGISGGSGAPFHSAAIGNGGGPTPSPSGGAGAGRIVLQFSLDAPALATPADGAVSVESKPSITGTAVAGTVVVVSVDGGQIECTEASPVIAADDGSFTCTPITGISDGTHEVSVISEDPLSPESVYPTTAAHVFEVLAEDPALEFTKTADDSLVSEPAVAGDQVTYAFELENTGNIEIDGLTITDDLAGLSEIDISWPGAAGVLLPGDVAMGSAEYSLTQADIDAGELANVALLTGATSRGTPVDTSASARIGVMRVPAVQLKKTADVSIIREANQIVEYSFEVANAGNVTLQNLAIDEESFSGAGELSTTICPVSAVLPGTSTTCTATYTSTASDLSKKSIVNTASAIATAPDATTVRSGASTVSISIDPEDSVSPGTPTEPGTPIVPGHGGEATGPSLASTGDGELSPMLGAAIALVIVGGLAFSVFGLRRKH